MTNKISNNLYDALQKLNRNMHRGRHRTIKSNVGIHHGKIKLLILISKNDGIIQRDLAEMLDMRPSSLTEMISSLEKSLLIKRQQDENDRRIMHVYLTEEGKNIIEDFVKSKDDLPDFIFGCLSEEEKEKMLEIVNKINLSLDFTDKEESDIENKEFKNICCNHKHGGKHRKCGKHEKFNEHGENKKGRF